MEHRASADTDVGDARKDDVMAEQRRGIDTDKDEVKLEVYDEDEHGQVGPEEKEEK